MWKETGIEVQIWAAKSIEKVFKKETITIMIKLKKLVHHRLLKIFTESQKSNC